MRSPKPKLRPVVSGIGFDEFKSGKGIPAVLPVATVSPETTDTAFITSRTARVLLAGAGFLADAVRCAFI